MRDRETIYSKVFDLFAGGADFKTTGRRVKMWADVPRTSQPALFMAQTGEIVTRTKGIPGKWTLTVKLYLYCYAPNDREPIGPVINPLLDRIVGLVETKGMPDGTRRPLLPGETNDLGIAGVSHCWIEGSIETDEGALGSQGVAIIPLSILTV